MVILVTGDRNWVNKTVIKIVLSTFNDCTFNDKNNVIVHGAARGADTLAGIVARELRMQVKEYPAKWSEHGKSAGPIRNKLMYDSEHPDIVIAFHNDLENSKGTKHMVGIAKKGKTPILHVTETTATLIN